MRPCQARNSTTQGWVSLPSVGQQPISHVRVHAEHDTPCTVGLASQHGSNDSLDFMTLKETKTCSNINVSNCNTMYGGPIGRAMYRLPCDDVHATIDDFEATIDDFDATIDDVDAMQCNTNPCVI